MRAVLLLLAVAVVAVLASAESSASVPSVADTQRLEQQKEQQELQKTRTGLHLRARSAKLAALLQELVEVAEVNLVQLGIDVCLLVFTLYVVLRRPVKIEGRLSPKEEEELIAEWVPEPLFPAVADNRTKLELESTPLIVEITSTKALVHRAPLGQSVFAGASNAEAIENVGVNVVDGVRGNASKEQQSVWCLNLARSSCLGFVGDDDVCEAATKALYKYGTGSCGPRGFYGTIDAHLDLEKKIRSFTGAEDALIYAYGFATVSSVIPCFAGRGDLLVVDKGVSFAIQAGIRLSRSTVLWFEHNDMNDLERILKEVAARDAKRSTPKNVRNQRRFIVVEGCYANTGALVPLLRVVELKEQYKFRVVMDESWSLGMIGETGRGVTEHYGVPVSSIELICANLATTTGSVGGLCLGDSQMVYHMRLHAYGYVYSASLPPLLARAAETALGLIDETAEGDKPPTHSRLHTFWMRRDRLRMGLNKVPGLKRVLQLCGNALAPMLHLQLAPAVAAALPSRDEQEAALQSFCDAAFRYEGKESPLLLTRSKYIPSLEFFDVTPSVRVTVSSPMSEADIDDAIKVIVVAAATALEPLLGARDATGSAVSRLRKTRTMEETAREANHFVGTTTPSRRSARR